MNRDGYKDPTAERAIKNLGREKKAQEQLQRERENIIHPKHYRIKGRRECWDEMLDIFGADKLMAFCELNIYKYEYRFKLKGGYADLEKARAYKQKLKELRASKEGSEQI